MAPYSMDCKSGYCGRRMRGADADAVAARFAVSRAWVHRLVQRRRETGSIAQRKQTKLRSRVLAGQEERLVALITERPDATLAGYAKRCRRRLR
jgi:transposase